MSGSITAESAGVMYTSIPYDKGWTILVDGKAVTPRKMFDTFLAVDIGEGTTESAFPMNRRDLGPGLGLPEPARLSWESLCWWESAGRRKRTVQ